MIHPSVLSFTLLSLLRYNFRKLDENLWYATYYLCSVAFGMWTLTKIGLETLEPLTCPLGNDGVAELEFYYYMQMGFYASSLAFLVGYEKRTKDFPLMVMHHFVTLFLVFFSFYTYNWRVGFFVTFLHDISDIFLYTSKYFHNLSKENSVWNIPTYIEFALFVLFFAGTRLYVFPRYVIWPCILKADQVGEQAHWPIGALVALFVMHCYWFFLILKMINRLLKETPDKVEDVREEERKKK